VGQALGIRGAGTIEFRLDRGGDWEFVAARAGLRPEHPATEMLTGTDLVEWQLRIAAGGKAPGGPEEAGAPVGGGHAVALRVDLDLDQFRDGPRELTGWREPAGAGVRVDPGYDAGDRISGEYDPLLAELCVWAEDRDGALRRARAAVAQFQVSGVRTSLGFLAEILDRETFSRGGYDAGFLAPAGR
jgi:acetyl/propionyl-CoA carboxylase alpha subunit